MKRKIKVKKIWKPLAIGGICAATLTIMTACELPFGIGKNNEETQEIETEEVKDSKYINDIEQLERGRYYVETKDGYSLPYWGYTSGGIAWFTDADWNEIPTIYEGQKIVYRTNADFSEAFKFARYFDLGYSVGVVNMAKTSTGRYKFYVGEDSNQINPVSDASKLKELGDVNVTIESIGGIKVRSDIMSPVSSITGLTKDESYEAELYVGTEIQSRTLAADSRILYNVQTNTTSDYNFIRSEIIEIPIPDYFESGYYSVNGSGLFRYVKGTSYNENTDFNIMNADSKQTAKARQNTLFYSVDWTQAITYAETGSYIIMFEYDDNYNPDLLKDDETYDTLNPVYIKVNTGGSEPIRFSDDDGDGIISGSFNAMEGTYPMEIYNIYGRTYNYTLLRNNDKTDAATETLSEEQMQELEEMKEQAQNSVDDLANAINEIGDGVGDAASPEPASEEEATEEATTDTTEEIVEENTEENVAENETNE